LREPSLYLSLYFKRHRAEYYERLDRVRTHGDWEGWLSFFLLGVEQTSQQAVDTASRLLTLLNTDRERARALGRKSGSVLQVFECFAQRPLLSATEIQRRQKLSAPTINKAIKAMIDLGLLNEITGQRPHPVWLYQDFSPTPTQAPAPP